MASNKRIALINLIINDLLEIKPRSTGDQLYSIEQNVAFFRAAKSVPKYLKWLFTSARRLNGDRLLEINDIPLKNIDKWDNELYRGLVGLARIKRLNFFKPLIFELATLIEAANRPYLMVELGAGAMEIDRQLIELLLKKGHKHKTVIVGFDKSRNAQRIASENIQSLGKKVTVYHVNNLNASFLKEITSKTKTLYTVILAGNNIFELSEIFGAKTFDLAYHSLFRHHMRSTDKVAVDEILSRIAHIILEFDGYHSWSVMFPQSITGWQNPVFLNGSIFSNARYITRGDLKEHAKDKKLLVEEMGRYLLEVKT